MNIDSLFNSIEKSIQISKNALVLNAIKNNKSEVFFKFDLDSGGKPVVVSSYDEVEVLESTEDFMWNKVSINIISLPTFYLVSKEVEASVTINRSFSRESIIIKTSHLLSIREIEFIKGLLNNISIISIIGLNDLEWMETQVTEPTLVYYNGEEPKSTNINIIFKSY